MIKMTTLGEYIKLARLGKSLSKSELARRAGITPQYVTDIETNRVTPSEDKIEKLVGVLELEEVKTFRMADKVPSRILDKAKKEYYGE
jgi:transcriptional regulator with XRE-family HTH domain